MIVEFSYHLVAKILINILSLMFVLFLSTRIMRGRHYEDDLDRRALSFFLAGIYVFSISIIADTFGLLGMHSYLISEISIALWRLLSSALIACGAYCLLFKS